MSKPSNWSYARSTSIRSHDITDACRERALKSWLCAECGSVKPFAGPVEVQVEGAVPRRQPISSAGEATVILVRWDFLRDLGIEVVERDLLIGKVFDERGDIMSEWASCIGRQKVIVRGSEHVAHRQCGECGRNLYFAMGDPYLFPAPPEDVDILDGGRFEFVLKSYLVDRIDRSKWQRIDVGPLPVVTAPIDALGDLTWH